MNLKKANSKTVISKPIMVGLFGGKFISFHAMLVGNVSPFVEQETTTGCYEKNARSFLLHCFLQLSV